MSIGWGQRALFLRSDHGLDQAGGAAALSFGRGVATRRPGLIERFRERYPDLRLPASERNSQQMCSIPLFPSMTDQDVERVIQALHDIAGV